MSGKGSFLMLELTGPPEHPFEVVVSGIKRSSGPPRRRSIPGIESALDFAGDRGLRGDAFGFQIPFDGSGHGARPVAHAGEFPSHDYDQGSNQGEEQRDDEPMRHCPA